MYSAILDKRKTICIYFCVDGRINVTISTSLVVDDIQMLLLLVTGAETGRNCHACCSYVRVKASMYTG